jgi:hypothetical protein
MRAKRRGTYVYTEPGFGAGIEIVPAAVAVDDACPHGGFRIGNVLVCGKCGDSEHQLGLAILYIAKKVAYQVTGKTFTTDDVIGSVSLALVLNRDRILKANNPGALAYVIGRRAALRFYRPGRSAPTIAVSQMNLPEDDGDRESLETTSQRLEFLAGRASYEEEWREVLYR